MDTKADNPYSFNTVAVTGATSSIGTAIIRECIKNNISVLAFMSPDSSHKSRVPSHPLVKNIYCPLEDMHSFEANGLTADAFFHLGWGHTNSQIRNAPGPQVDNIRYSLDSVTVASKLGCSVYVGSGSQAEYGRKNCVIDENTSVNPEGGYGMAKLCSGQMTRLECQKYGIRHIWPRIFSTYGINAPDATILNYSIRELLSGHKPSLTGCEQIWDFIYVDDAARALLLLADKGRDGELYCVASGHSRPMKDYIEILRAEIGGDVAIGYGDISYSDTTVMHLEGNINKLAQETGFAPQISFEEGIRKTISWAKEYYQL